VFRLANRICRRFFCVCAARLIRPAASSRQFRRRDKSRNNTYIHPFSTRFPATGQSQKFPRARATKKNKKNFLLQPLYHGWAAGRTGALAPSHCYTGHAHQLPRKNRRCPSSPARGSGQKSKVAASAPPPQKAGITSENALTHHAEGCPGA
jgi:hypothetical protein